MKKACTKCKIIKGVDDFYAQPTGMLGRTAECKTCRLSRCKKYDDAHREEKARKFRQRYDPEVQREKNARFREENPNYMKVYRKKKEKK